MKITSLAQVRGAGTQTRGVLVKMSRSVWNEGSRRGVNRTFQLVRYGR